MWRLFVKVRNKQLCVQAFIRGESRWNCSSLTSCHVISIISWSVSLPRPIKFMFEDDCCRHLPQKCQCGHYEKHFIIKPFFCSSLSSKGFNNENLEKMWLPLRTFSSQNVRSWILIIHVSPWRIALSLNLHTRSASCLLFIPLFVVC